jgi:hypothetical protein
MEMLCGGVVLTVPAAVTGEQGRLDPGHISGRSPLAVFYLIGPGPLLAMTCYVIALRRLSTGLARHRDARRARRLRGTYRRTSPSRKPR